MRVFKGVLISIVSVVLLGLLGFGVLHLELFTKRYFKPKFQNVERKVFKETRSYNEGKIQDLAKYMKQYEQATKEDKQVIASAIRHQFADYNCDELPYGLKVFLQQVRGY